MSLDLNSLIRAAKNSDIIITPRLNEWLLRHGDDAVPADVATIVYDQLVTTPRDRSASFSASSAGMCPRRQMLQFLGMPEEGAIDPRLQNIFNDGKWRHLRWQTMLLSAGLLTEIEVPLVWRRMRSRGTMDGWGVVPEDHEKVSWRGKDFGFELKGVSAYLYPKYRKDEEIKNEHRRQVSRYFLMGGFEKFVVVYENKGTNEWFEWVVEPDDDLIEEQRLELELLNGSVDTKTLPPIKPSCKRQVGPEFNDCPYGGPTCLRSGNWPNLKE